MRLIPYSGDDFPALSTLRRRMDRLFENYFRGIAEPEVSAEWWPHVDIVETPETVVLKAEVPGVEAKDIEISVTGDTLTLKGQKQLEKEEKGKTFFRREIASGSFTRSFTLPVPIDAEHVEAVDRNGVLTVTVPKRAEARARKITVQVK